MFLEGLRRRNPRLIEQAIVLHQAGSIPANSYVIDLDAVTHNAALIRTAANKAGLKVLAMTKQMGRNGDFCRAVQAGGINRAVAVDMECARACVRAGLRIGHLGHLVQIPSREAEAAQRARPDYWTVFSMQRATEATRAAARQGRRQDLLVRLYAPGDHFYNGHEGGFPADTVAAIAEDLDDLPGGRFAGITTFPALLFNGESRTIQPTHNLVTLARAAERLRKAGRDGIEVNAPGTTSSLTLQLLADHGATQCEPGHGLTGTTPLHALEDLPELPAVCYVSEVSHFHAGRAYCFGGGFYVDPVFPEYDLRVVAGCNLEAASGPLHRLEIPPASAIDYYGMVTPAAGATLQVGDTVVCGFRPQAFVTRAYTVGLSGISSGEAAPLAIHDALGRVAGWPG